MVTDTIAAIATAVGEGGIGIIRISGTKAGEVISRIFHRKKKRDLQYWDSHTLHYGTLHHPDTGKIIDEVLVAWMKAPSTFTTEDVAEIHCHGGTIPLRECLEAALRAGCRLAEPGEFARRAFLGGRLDLAQAEAIIEIIRSKTSTSLSLAMDQLNGRLSEKIKNLRENILHLLAQLEALIDFPDEDVPDISLDDLKKQLQQIKFEIDSLLEGAKTGKLLREGIKTVIAGRPNVGKSSLLNALLNEQRAIVTEIPGTTRDIIEEIIDMDGIPVKLVDTAGIRETTDLVEKIGVNKAKQYLQDADLIIYLIDGTVGIKTEDYDLFKLFSNTPVILLFSKVDLINEDVDTIIDIQLVNEVNIIDYIKISTKNFYGLDKLQATIRQLVYGGEVKNQRVQLVAQARHREAIERAQSYINEVAKALELQMAADFLTIDLKAAWEALGEISGDTVGEDILDRIFSQFCIGK